MKMEGQTILSETVKEDKYIEDQLEKLEANAEETGSATEVKAEKLFEEFKEVSVTEFFRKNKSHLGYSGKLRSLTTVVHELVTNSLDACEESGILPNIIVEINELGKEHYRVIERDNGPGIPKKHIHSVFGKMLAGTKFHRNIQGAAGYRRCRGYDVLADDYRETFKGYDFNRRREGSCSQPDG
jgi:hypothetical protein